MERKNTSIYSERGEGKKTAAAKEKSSDQQQKIIGLIFLLTATWIISTVCVWVRARIYVFPYYRMRRADNFQICNFAFILFWCRRQHRYTCLFGCFFSSLFFSRIVIAVAVIFGYSFWNFVCFLAYVSLNLHTIFCFGVCAKLFATSVLYADLFIMVLFFHGFCFSFLTSIVLFFRLFSCLLLFLWIFLCRWSCDGSARLLIHMPSFDCITMHTTQSILIHSVR